MEFYGFQRYLQKHMLDEEGYVADPSTPAGVRKVIPVEPQLEEDLSALKAATVVSVEEVEEGPVVVQTATLEYGEGGDQTWTVAQLSQPVPTDEDVTAWVAGLVTAVAVAQSTDSPEYRKEFFDAGPTHQEAFRVVAGAVAEHEPDTVECNHALFHEAVRLKQLINPKRYCRNMRCALAVVIMRHPSDWGVNNESCEVLDSFIEAGMLPSEITTADDALLKTMGHRDPRPIIHLKTSTPWK
ncbi:hypothetical protein MTO96_043526 [Rhipicephalus appendiculatus]